MPPSGWRASEAGTAIDYRYEKGSRKVSRELKLFEYRRAAAPDVEAAGHRETARDKELSESCNGEL
jgi:hypothetical protein